MKFWTSNCTEILNLLATNSGGGQKENKNVFLVCEMGPLPKNSAINPISFCFLEESTLGPQGLMHSSRKILAASMYQQGINAVKRKALCIDCRLKTSEPEFMTASQVFSSQYCKVYPALAYRTC